jgi:hypothetical protein
MRIVASGPYECAMLGVFGAFGRDLEHCLAPRWPEHVRVISPERTLDLVDSLASRARARR